MGFTPYSKVVEPALWSPPLSENILMSGAIFNEKNMKESQQNLQNAADSFLNIQTNIPQDAQVLNQRKQEFQTAVKDLNLSNLNNPQTVSQLNQLITKFSNDQDILGIAQRANSVNKELQTKKEYESKGKQYVSPILDQADDYIKGGNYYKDTRFNKSGWVSPDTTKAMQDAVKAVTKKTYNSKTGIVESVAKPEDVSAAFYEIMKNNPSYQKDLDYSFQKETKDINWDDKGQEFVQSKLDKLQQQIYQAQSIGDQESFEMATHELNRLSKLSNPALIGNQLKDQYFQNFINTQLEQVGYANDVSDFEKIERDPIDMKLLEHKLRMQEKSEKESLKMYGIKKAIDATIASGQTPDYEAIDIGDYSSLIYNPIESRDGKFGTSATGKTTEQKAAEDAAKAEEERIKKIPAATKEQIQQLYKNNKTFENNFNTWMTKNGYPPNAFTATDIEKVESDDKTQTYKLTLDTDYIFGGGSKVIDISKDEFEKMKGETPSSTGGNNSGKIDAGI